LAYAPVTKSVHDDFINLTIYMGIKDVRYVVYT